MTEIVSYLFLDDAIVISMLTDIYIYLSHFIVTSTLFIVTSPFIPIS